MNSNAATRDLETNLIRGERNSSFTFKRSLDFAASRPSFSNTAFGRLERAYPEKIGFYYLLCSIVFMSLNAYFTQVADELPVSEIIFLRSLFMMIGIYIFISRYNSDLDVGDKRYKRVVIILCIIGFPTALSYVYGVVTLQLVEAITIMISTPIMACIFSWFIFAQHFKKEQLISIVVWLAGITLVIRPSFFKGAAEEENIETLEDTNHFRGVIACLINALLSASSSIVVKATNVRVQPIMLMTYGTLINFVFSGILSFINGFVIPTMDTWLNLVGIGFLFFYGQFFLMKSLEHASAGVNAALINNIQIVLIYIIQVAAVQVWPSFWSVIGTVLVVIACIVLASINR